MMPVKTVPNGVVICGSYPDVKEELVKHCGGGFPLVIADPPYGNIVDDAWDRCHENDVAFSEWMFCWTRVSAELSLEGAALYVWGGIGRPKFRPFYRYVADVENVTPYTLANHVTWKKKRGYGIQWNYLFTREELAYLVKGDMKKPRKFTVPLLDVKRGYAGYDKEHPAKSEYYRRTNVWDDVTEILRGKKHVAQKPQKLHEIIIGIHTEPGETVLDPFAGSGTTGFAARALDRRFVLVENDEQQFEKTVSDLET
jgi:DNA modification methylase